MKIIYVYYLNIGNIPPQEVENYCKRILQKLEDGLQDDNSISFLIPTRTGNTRLECINPVYITNEELIKKHEELIKNLNEKLTDGEFFKG